MTQETKVMIGVGIFSVILVVGAAFLMGNPSGSKPTRSSSAVDPKLLIRSNSHTQGPANAKVKVVEFADYQCPACARTNPVLKQLLEEYKGKITFVYRHFPLPQHKNAILAAKAAEVAGETGEEKFWEMTNLLYERQSDWSESDKAADIFRKYAKELKLDEQAFSQILESSKYNSVIQDDKNDGIALGVNSTPTIFINNKKLEVASTYQNLKDNIDSELKK